MNYLPHALAAAMCFAAPVYADAVDSCLIGTWAVEMDDLAQVYANQMGATSATANGAVFMNIAADGMANIIAESLTFHVVIPNTPEMDVTVTGRTDYTLAAIDGAFTATVVDFAYVARADVMGTVMEIPLSAADGLFGGALGTYGCTADSISFENTGDTPNMPRNWRRVAG